MYFNYSTNMPEVFYLLAIFRRVESGTQICRVFEGPTTDTCKREALEYLGSLYPGYWQAEMCFAEPNFARQQQNELSSLY